MQLTLRLATEFTSSTRQRGLTYYQQGRVRLQESLPNKVAALVAGEGTYHVGLSWTDPSLLMECDCPYFFDNGPCKHLWATILAAQGKGHLGEVAVANKIVVELGDTDDYDDDDEDPFELLPPPSSAKIAAPPGTPEMEAAADRYCKWAADTFVPGFPVAVQTPDRLSDRPGSQLPQFRGGAGDRLP